MSDFTTWRSLVDGEEIGVIPDSVTNQWLMDEGTGTTLNDNIGNIPASLSGASWLEDADAEGGWKTSYDGTDDYWETDDAFGINGSDYTGMVWLEYDDSMEGDSTAYLHAMDGTNDNGWGIGMSGGSPGQPRLVHRDAGSFNMAELSTSINDGEWYLLAAAGSGDTGTLYLYDSDGYVEDASFNESRGQQDVHLRGMARMNDSFHAPGNVDAPAVSTDTEMTKSEIEEYWQATLR